MASSERLSCEAAGPGLLRSRKKDGPWKAPRASEGMDPLPNPVVSWLGVGFPLWVLLRKGGALENIYSRSLAPLSAGQGHSRGNDKLFRTRLAFGRAELEAVNEAASPLPGSALLWAEAAQDSVPAAPLAVPFLTEFFTWLEGQICGAAVYLLPSESGTGTEAG